MTVHPSGIRINCRRCMRLEPENLVNQKWKKMYGGSAWQGTLIWRTRYISYSVKFEKKDRCNSRFAHDRTARRQLLSGQRRSIIFLDKTDDNSKTTRDRRVRKKKLTKVRDRGIHVRSALKR